MATDLTSLLKDALQLPAGERADLVAQLLASLEPPGADDLDDAEWLAEIEARARRAIAGEPSTAWADIRDRLRNELRGK